MTGAIVAFAFAALGSKVMLGLAVVYGLLPEAGACSRCDGETTAVEPPAGTRTLAHWLRLQSRWCPHCGESFLARGSHPPRLWVGRPDAGPAPEPAEPGQALVRKPQ